MNLCKNENYDKSNNLDKSSPNSLKDNDVVGKIIRS